MKTRSKAALSTLALGLFLGGTSTALAGSIKWTHDPASNFGPDSWGGLDKKLDRFRDCATGTRQSPVNVVTSDTELDRKLPGLVFSYSPTDLVVLNNGHTIEVHNHADSQLVVGKSPDEDTYKLVQFHIHAGSEHTIDGRPSAIEAHLVHMHDEGGLAVVGVMMVESLDGGTNSAIAQMLDNAPSTEGENHVHGISIDPAELLPPPNRNGSYSHYTYMGSLTTPPCSEGVQWFVLKEPVEVSTDQVTQLHALIANFKMYRPDYDQNFRPTQPLGTRVIYRSQ